ncbi:MAG TPA: ABC transporter permease, partial [Planctomycetota bacterium]
MLAWLLTVLAVHAACFLLVRGARGGPFDAERELPPEVEAALRAEYRLDQPLARQYGHALGGLLRGDFGPSLRYRGVSVNQVIADSLPLSLLLGAGGLAVALLLGVPAGLYAARRRGGATDAAVRVASSLALALPNFVLAGFLVLLFAFTLAWLPPAGLAGPRSLLLPWASLGLPFAAQIARLVRAGALQALASEAVRAARARGVGA